MMQGFLVCVCLTGLVLGIPHNFELPKLKDDGVHWALLVAGSNGWMNYRHQVKRESLLIS